MNDHFIELARKTLKSALLAMLCGGFAACTDSYDLDDSGNSPSWLGGSIYEALKNPQMLENSGQSVLTGSFNNYVRLIDDLGYAETLNKTGSMTLFVANDSAFERFFANNTWHVSKYEDLTMAQKMQLLRSSMLKNAILIEMLSNVTNDATSVTSGLALRHETVADVTDNIRKWGRDDMPANNAYWEKYANDSLYVVMDASLPMMVHFTEEQMTNNGITTRGENSDFHVITGTPYDTENRPAFIFRNRVINKDVTCQNGYIHQMQDVLVPPGNLAELIRENGNSNLFSRMLDRFCAPFYDTKASNVTKNYNDYAQAHGLPQVEKIYQLRYMSDLSQSSKPDYDPNDVKFPNALPFDPGWNEYAVEGKKENGLRDIAAMFVPTDTALANFFLPGGEGEFLINEYGKKPNTLANLEENIDSISIQNIMQLVENLMKPSFTGSVPSKFGSVVDKANDPMGLSLDVLHKNADGTYDVKIANNGVAYMLNQMFAPPSLVAVSAPVTLRNSNMRIMNWAIYDGKGDNSESLNLGLNYYAYLEAMSANYAFFIPTDDAFRRFYIDPSSLSDEKPRALRFFLNENKAPYVFCSAWNCNKNADGEWVIDESADSSMVSNFKSQLTDILNYHTVVLSKNETLAMNGNKYFKTKHGGTIVYKPAGSLMPTSDGKIIYEAGTVSSDTTCVAGNAIESQVTKVYNQKNGVAYAINQIIQAPENSVLTVLKNNPQFSEFLKLCIDLDMEKIMAFASDKLVEKNPVTNKMRMDAYITFAAKKGLTDNVSYFNSYNYTVYVPDNDAMQKAYDLGLPKWSDMKAIYDQYADQLETEKTAGSISQEVQDARKKVLAMIEEVNSFIRYHFQDNSIYADKVVEGGTFPTACSDSLGIREKITVSGGGDKLTIVDNQNQSQVIDATNATKLVNEMARDYVLDKTAHSILTSSFAVIHQISTPLNCHKGNNNRYDQLWTGAGARERLDNYYKRFESYLYKRYDQAPTHGEN